MKLLMWRKVLLLLLLASPAYAQYNPCANQAQVQLAVINISSATTTRIVQNPDVNTPALTNIVVCSYSIVIDGAATAQTAQFEYGTGATCGTGTTVLSGAFKGFGAVGNAINVTGNTLPFGKLPAGTHLCIVTTQSAVVVGHLSYVLTSN
jgi:hypothetical protein